MNAPTGQLTDQPKLERGTTVMIFQKPITRGDFEGMGLLDEYLYTRYDGLELWTVWFGTDGPYRRLVNPDRLLTREE